MEKIKQIFEKYFTNIVGIGDILIYCVPFYDNDVIWKNYDNGFEGIGFWTIKQLFKPLTYIDIYLLEECEPMFHTNVQHYKQSVMNKMLEVVKNF
jgi:hypothetical protein